MERVMVDNWLLEDAAINLRDEPEKPGRSLSDLLMAILLWEEVCFAANEYALWYSDIGELMNLLEPIEDTKWDFVSPYGLKSLGFLSYHLYDSEYDHYYYEKELVGGVDDSELACIGIRAQHYLKLSGENDCSYLPFYKRQEYLAKNLKATEWKLSDAVMRISNLEMLDRQVKQYLEETFKALLDMPNIEFSMPLLTQFIIANTPEGMSPVEHAFHMRMEGPLIQYRKYLQELSNAVEQQDWKEFRKLGSFSIDAVKSVIEMDKGHTRSITASILPTPTIMLDTGFLTASTDPSKIATIKLSDLKYKKYHLTFLRDLTKFGINKISL